MIRENLYCVLVCGGRYYADREFLFRYMDTVLFLHDDDIMLMTGSCPTGADRYAEDWAKERELIYVGVPAQWSKYGRRAGMTRNSEMAVISQANTVVVFPGQRGTLNMLALARAMEPRPLILLPCGEFWK